MTNNPGDDPLSWDPALDAVTAAPKHHKVLFENDNLRVLEVTLEPNDEEPVHHHRWPSVFVFDQVAGPSTISRPMARNCLRTGMSYRRLARGTARAAW